MCRGGRCYPVWRDRTRESTRHTGPRKNTCRRNCWGIAPSPGRRRCRRRSRTRRRPAPGRPPRLVVSEERVMVRARPGGGLAEPVGIPAAPAVVAACDALVDLLPGVLADVVDEDLPRAGLNCKGERVAQAEGEDQL